MDPQRPVSGHQSPPPILDYQAHGRPGQSVRVRRFSSVFEANLALSAVESRGIRAQLVGEAVQTVMGPYGMGSIGVDLLVTENEAADARHILDEIDHRRADRAAAAEVSPRCPRCGHALSRGYDRRRLVAGLVLMMMVAPVAFIGDSIAGIALVLLFALGAGLLVAAIGRRTCRRCRHVWVVPDPDEDAPEIQP